MHFSESLQGSKSAITMRSVSTKSTLLSFLLVYNFLFLIYKRKKNENHHRILQVRVSLDSTNNIFFKKNSQKNDTSGQKQKK